MTRRNEIHPLPRNAAEWVSDKYLLHKSDWVPSGPPPTPTQAIPGSAEKIRILAERMDSGYDLWHVEDRVAFEDHQAYAEFTRIAQIEASKTQMWGIRVSRKSAYRSKRCKALSSKTPAVSPHKNSAGRAAQATNSRPTVGDRNGRGDPLSWHPLADRRNTG